MIKCISEGNNLPYRNLALNVLGAISPIKTQTKSEGVNDIEVENNVDGEEGFISPGRRRRRRDSYIPKEVIFQNITMILDGFETQRNFGRR